MKALSDKAREIAEDAQIRVTDLQAQLEQVEARQREIKSQLDSARLAPKRLADFEPMRGGNPQCPRCWILGGINSSLEKIADDIADATVEVHHLLHDLWRIEKES